MGSARATAASSPGSSSPQLRRSRWRANSGRITRPRRPSSSSRKPRSVATWDATTRRSAGTSAAFASANLPAGSARDQLELELELGIAGVRFRQGEFSDCISRAREVVAKALAVGDELQLGNAYMLLHLVHTQQGSPERAAFRGLALPIFEDLGDLK